MDCTECTRLDAERGIRQLDYTIALGRMWMAKGKPGHHEKYMKFIANVQAARVVLDFVDAQILHHQDRHVVNLSAKKRAPAN